MRTQTMLVGGPHNGALFGYSHVGGEAPSDLIVGTMGDVGEKVTAAYYRLIDHAREGPVSMASYEFQAPVEKAPSLVNVWIKGRK